MVMSRRRAVFQDASIELAHGSGGKATRKLIEGLIAPYFFKEDAALTDSATLSVGDLRLALTADSFVVHPLRFPGGSIGELAVNGTINDLAMGGAEPQALLVTFILEAGMDTKVLQEEIATMAATAEKAGVAIVGGDTKVVEHGKGDGLYITTAGLGMVHPHANLNLLSIKEGDRVILSGPIGDHGITILLARGEIDLQASIASDTRPLWPLVKPLFDVYGEAIRWMRDPTRGGVATALNELARDTGLTVMLEEAAIAVRKEVRGACELLGLDPLHIANEGQFLAVVSAESAEDVLSLLHRTPGGEEARIIGSLKRASRPGVLVRSDYGSTRIIDMLVGDPLPRIC